MERGVQLGAGVSTVEMNESSRAKNNTCLHCIHSLVKVIRIRRGAQNHVNAANFFLCSSFVVVGVGRQAKEGTV